MGRPRISAWRDLNIEAAQNIIDNSFVICVYGMSFGRTDKMWWERLIAWLRGSKERVLILCAHEEGKGFERQVPQEIHEYKLRLARSFLDAAGVDADAAQASGFFDRILVLINPDIFNFAQCTLPKDGSGTEG